MNIVYCFDFLLFEKMCILLGFFVLGMWKILLYIVFRDNIFGNNKLSKLSGVF